MFERSLFQQAASTDLKCALGIIQLFGYALYCLRFVVDIDGRQDFSGIGAMIAQLAPIVS